MRATLLVTLVTLLLGPFLSPAVALAGDQHFEADTMFLLSVNSVPELRSGFDASQYGQWLSDPEIAPYFEKFVALLKRLVLDELDNTNTKDAELKAQMTRLWSDYSHSLLHDTTGRAAISLSMGKHGDKIAPVMIAHFQGGEVFETLNNRLIELLAVADPSLARVTTELHDVSFRGFLNPREDTDPAAPAPSGIFPADMPPEGIFFGQKGNDYYIGLDRKALTAYLASMAGEETTPRLGDDSYYKQSLAALGNGQMHFMVNLNPFWGLIESQLGPDDGPQFAMVKNMGLSSLHAFHGNFSAGASGMTTRFHVGVGERVGLAQLIPSENINLRLPDVVPTSAMSAAIVRLPLNKLLAIAEEIVVGTGMMPKEEFVGTLAQGEMMLGVSPAALIKSFEGSMLVVEFDAERDGMEDPLGFGALGIGIKLSDTGPFETLLQGFMANPETANMFTVEEFMGRKLHLLGMFGDPAMGGPAPGFVVEGNWLLVGMNAEILRELIRTGAGANSDKLVNSSKYQSLASQAGTQGFMISFQDIGRTMTSMTDVFALLPDAPEDMTADGDQFFELAEAMLNPATIRKYFGDSIATMKVMEDGSLLMIGLTPAKTAAKARPTEEVKKKSTKEF